MFGMFLTLSLKLMHWYVTSVSRGFLYEKFGNKCVKILKFWRTELSISDKQTSELRNYSYEYLKLTLTFLKIHFCKHLFIRPCVKICAEILQKTIEFSIIQREQNCCPHNSCCLEAFFSGVPPVVFTVQVYIVL